MIFLTLHALSFIFFLPIATFPLFSDLLQVLPDGQRQRVLWPRLQDVRHRQERIHRLQGVPTCKEKKHHSKGNQCACTRIIFSSFQAIDVTSSGCPEEKLNWAFRWVSEIRECLRFPQNYRERKMQVRFSKSRTLFAQRIFDTKVREKTQ